MHNLTMTWQRRRKFTNQAAGAVEVLLVRRHRCLASACAASKEERKPLSVSVTKQTMILTQWMATRTTLKIGTKRVSAHVGLEQSEGFKGEVRGKVPSTAWVYAARPCLPLSTPSTGLYASLMPVATESNFLGVKFASQTRPAA